MMIQYSFPQMIALAGDLRTNSGALTSQSDDIASSVTTIQSAWSSPEALDAFLDVQRRWDAEFSDSRALLDRLSRAVEDSAARMQSTDGSVANTFQR